SRFSLHLARASFLFRLLPPPPRSPLFPYTTLFRSPPEGRMAAVRHPQRRLRRPARTRGHLRGAGPLPDGRTPPLRSQPQHRAAGDRKSTRLNSSHVKISYAVFCLKKKNDDRPELNA